MANQITTDNIKSFSQLNLLQAAQISDGTKIITLQNADASDPDKVMTVGDLKNFISNHINNLVVNGSAEFKGTVNCPKKTVTFSKNVTNPTSWQDVNVDLPPTDLTPKIIVVLRNWNEKVPGFAMFFHAGLGGRYFLAKLHESVIENGYSFEAKSENNRLFVKCSGVDSENDWRVFLLQ